MSASSGWYLLVLRWVARLTGLAFVALIALFWIREGGPDLGEAAPVQVTQHLLFLTVPLGFLMAWKWEGLGGIVSVAALLGFYLIEFLMVGRFPGGWVFPSLAVPGVLFGTCFLLDRKPAAPLAAGGFP